MTDCRIANAFDADGHYAGPEVPGELQAGRGHCHDEATEIDEFWEASSDAAQHRG